VRLTRESLGEVELFAADATFTFQIHGLSDRDMPGRLFLSLKRWLGDCGSSDLSVFWRAVAAGVARDADPLAPRPGAGAGRRRTRACGTPGPVPGRQRPGGGATPGVCRARGLPRCTLLPEPVAAIVSFLHKNPQRPGDQFLCFDFGGGTLDLCVVRALAGSFEILATHGIPLGGDVIDQLIFRNKVFPELGDGCPLSMTGPDGALRMYRFLLLPYENELLNWQLAYRLNQPRLVAPISRNLSMPGEVGEKFRRLHSVIRHNLAYRIMRAVESAKIRLSAAEETND